MTNSSRSIGYNVKCNKGFVTALARKVTWSLQPHSLSYVGHSTWSSILFKVSVPVLSEQSIFMPANAGDAELHGERPTGAVHSKPIIHDSGPVSCPLLLATTFTNLPAISSIEASLATIAPMAASSRDPRAMTVVVTTSMAIGIEATSNTTENDSCPR